MRTNLCAVSIVSSLLFTLLHAQPSRPEGNEPFPTPIMFTANAGQWRTGVRYAALRGNETAVFTTSGIALRRMRGSDAPPRRLNVRPFESPAWRESGMSLESPASGESGMSLAFAHPSRRMRIVAGERTDCLSNFYLGGDSARWRSGVANFATLTYKDVWPSVDVEYRERNGFLEQRFVLREGADVRDISLAVAGDGAASPPLHMLESWYEDAEGRRRPVNAALRRSAGGNVTFSLQPSPDMRRVILATEFCSYFRVTNSSQTFDNLMDVLPDSSNAVVAIGATQANKLWGDAYWASTTAPKQSDIVVAKYACGASAPSFVTHFGGTGYDAFIPAWTPEAAPSNRNEIYRYYGHSAAISTNGQVVIGGITTSPDFPVTAGAIQSQKRISYPTRDSLNPNGFLVRLNAQGQLLSSTYLGGPGFSGIGGMTLDRKGNVYITGTVDYDSLWFISPWAAQPRITNISYAKNWIHAAFIAKLSPACDSLIYATYYYAPYGIAFADSFVYLRPPCCLAPVPAIAVGRDEQLVCTGFSTIVHTYPEFPIPVTAGMRAGSSANKHDGFVTKFNRDASGYVFSTWFGGASDDYLHNVAVDADDNILLTGNTYSDDFPLKDPLVTKPFTPNRPHGFLSKLSATGDLLFSTYLTEDSATLINDETGGRSIAIDECGNIGILSITLTRDLFLRNPIDSERWRLSYWARSNVLTIVDPSCRNILLSTYLNDSHGGFRKLGFGPGSYVYLSGVGFRFFPADQHLQRLRADARGFQYLHLRAHPCPDLRAARLQRPIGGHDSLHRQTQADDAIALRGDGRTGERRQGRFGDRHERSALASAGIVPRSARTIPPPARDHTRHRREARVFLDRALRFFAGDPPARRYRRRVPVSNAESSLGMSVAGLRLPLPPRRDAGGRRGAENFLLTRLG
jgi:hypothetical protein